MTDLDLTAIRERANNATNGPWYAWDRGVGWHIALDPDGDVRLPEGMRTDLALEADAVFIAHARKDIPKLLDHVDNLEAGREIERRMLRNAVTRMEAVRELHPRGEFEDSPGDYYCTHCQTTAGIWPCPTIQAIDSD